MKSTLGVLLFLVLVLVPVHAAPAQSAEKGGEPARTYTATFSVARQGGNPPEREYVLALSDKGRPASLHAGARIAVPATSFPERGDAGSVVPVTSFTYQNIGFRATLEARAGKGGAVRLRGQVEDDRVGKEVPAKGESGTPELHTFKFVFDVVMSAGETRELARFDDQHTGRVVLSLKIE